MGKERKRRFRHDDEKTRLKNKRDTGEEVKEVFCVSEE